MSRYANKVMLSIFLLIQLTTLCLSSETGTNAEANSDAVDESSLALENKDYYCLRNVTYYEEKAVDKTREVEIKPSGVFKWFKKSKTQVEHYVDMVKVPHQRLKNDCCEGYAMAPNKTCLPVCEPACPANAFCRAPKMCQCRRGYDAVKSALNGTHYCEPRCASGCPYGGKCVAPELCECAPGYRAHAGSCIPTCASDCLNGRCIALNQCGCDAGYAKDSATGECVPLVDCGVVSECIETANSTERSDSGEGTISSVTALNINEAETTETELMATGTDENTITGNPAYNNTVSGDGDDDDIVLFPSNEEETNCTLQPCIGDTACKLVGSCACADGFIRHQPAPVNDVEVGPICMAATEQDGLTNARGADGGWTATFFVVVGVVVMMCALVVLFVKLWRHQHGSLNVEGKTEPCCRYDKNSTSSDSGHVDMC
ncbi:delta-like protein 1 [Bactrocera neohumeralis]|uniref:delta-like protein 1 n=1 Tax=Bactrocera neohumeralis TaxID=98809 RepID=UPI002165167F|nr:delta-like protein 1 [Bactrocera neohumeralis]